MYEYDEETAKQESDWVTTLTNSIYWLKAVIHQGGRVAAAVNEPYKHTNSRSQNTTQPMEEYFFLSACRKAHRWLDRLDLTTPEALAFMKLEKNAKEVRNNREHDEERYALGNTRKEPLRKVDAVTNLNLSVTASGTVFSNGKCLLGGIVDLAGCV